MSAPAACPPTPAYALGAALWEDIPPRDRDNWRPFGDHDEIPDGDYHALARLYPAEWAALDPHDDETQWAWRRIEGEYRRGYNDARADSLA